MTDELERYPDGTPKSLKAACQDVLRQHPLSFEVVQDAEASMEQKRMDVIWILAITQEARRRGAAGKYKRLSEMLDDIENMLMTGWRP